MIKLISINENGVAWVETDCGKIFGVVNAFKVIDEDGIAYPQSAMDILDNYTDINQDWDSEANLIDLSFENGESATLKICADSVELINNNQVN